MEDVYVLLLLPPIACRDRDCPRDSGVGFPGRTVGCLCRGSVAGICLVPHLLDCKGVLLVKALKDYFSDVNHDIRTALSTPEKVFTLLMAYVVTPLLFLWFTCMIILIIVAVVQSLVLSIVFGGIALLVAGAVVIVKVWFK